MNGIYYADAEPEDAWHPDDPPAVLLDNLCRRCTQLGEPRQYNGSNPTAWLDDIADRLERLRRGSFNERDRHRIELIDGDIEHLRIRLGGDDD